MSTKPKFINLSLTHSKGRDDSLHVKIVRPTHRHTFIFFIFPCQHRSFYHTLPSWYRDKSIFAAENRTYSYFIVIKTIRGAQALKNSCECFANLFGCSRTIVGAHLSLVGTPAPTEVYELTPMDSMF